MNLEIALPYIEELPFVNQSHFEMLLESIHPDDIVTIFTHMLFEQKTLLIAPKVDQLVPISFALHSLIYPFNFCIYVPCILNDGEDLNKNALDMICNPMNYYMGICQSDKEMALEILANDEFDPPLIIDVESNNTKVTHMDS